MKTHNVRACIHFMCATLFAGWFCFRSIAIAAPTPAPITLSGYNSDIVTDANTAVRFAVPADIGTADWFESGAVDDNGSQHNDGLTVGNFTSAFTNTVTGGHTVFQLQPFNGNNALLLHFPNSNSGVLNFVTPTAYDNLAILAAGYNAGANGLGTLVINSMDNTHSQILNYDAFDWGFGPSNVALGARGRNFDSGTDGKAFHYNQPVPFSLYETDLNLAALGLNTKPISSVTFTGGTIGDQLGGPNTSIFAVSGAVPEPSSILLSIAGFCGFLVWLCARSIRHNYLTILSIAAGVRRE